MPYEVIELNELEIDLVEQAKTTGWTVDGTIATHEVCNAGSIYLEGLTITAGQNYEVSYRINSISSGLVQPYAGTAPGISRTTAGFFTEVITATGANPEFRFYSDADAEIEIFNIRNTLQSTDLKQQNTIVWSERNNKWESFYTYNPDCAFSMFINLYTFKQGRTYIHRQNSASRNSFFGTQYKSIFQITSNLQPQQVKSFHSLSLQSNQLMITTEDGIETSLGQLSELIELDFLKDTLTSGVTSVEVYSKEGVFSAAFMRDKNSPDGIVDGDPLKGNYITIELITTEDTLLRLFTVNVVSRVSKIGAR